MNSILNKIINYKLAISITKPYIMENTIQATQMHCQYCFDVLINKLNNKPLPEYPKTLVDCEVPLFVTWKKNGTLRGCIGTFSPSRLSKLLPEYAITSSMRDPRFPPIKQDELKDLTVSVSLLVNFTPPTSDIYNWQVGRHGIVIKALYNNRPYSGTFLPEVAQQQKWDQKQTLEYLVRKAGYNGKYELIEDKIRLQTYQSSKAKLSYQEYLNLKGQSQSK